MFGAARSTPLVVRFFTPSPALVPTRTQLRYGLSSSILGLLKQGTRLGL